MERQSWKIISACLFLVQMDAQNLAVCLAPSLFALSNPLPKLHTSNSLVGRSSFRRTVVNPRRTHMNIATSKEVNESVVSWTNTHTHTHTISSLTYNTPWHHTNKGCQMTINKSCHEWGIAKTHKTAILTQSNSLNLICIIFWWLSLWSHSVLCWVFKGTWYGMGYSDSCVIGPHSKYFCFSLPPGFQ